MAVILFVDDEPQILKSLQRVFHDFEDHEYFFAASPKEALEILASKAVTVLVSDHKMPQMTGAEFLARVREKRPDTVRMLLTGQADLEAVQRAVNGGEVFRFFLKPWNDDDLRLAVKQAVNFHDLTLENRRLQVLTQEQNEQLSAANEQLEEQVDMRTRQLSDALYTARAYNEQLMEGMYKSALTIFEISRMARPSGGSHSQRVATHCVQAGRIIGCSGESLTNLEIAALLHDIGKMGLPSFIAEKHPQDLRPKEWDVYKTHPALGAEYLKGITRFEQAGKYILMHHERSNGSGFPAGHDCDKIPQEALLIGIMDEYDHLMSRQQFTPEFNYQFACQRFAEYSDREYPTSLIQAVLNYIATIRDTTSKQDEIRLGIADLFPNVVLARDVYSMSGHLLLPAGTKLTAQKIQRLRTIAKLDPLAEELYVSRNSSQSEAQPLSR